MIAGALAWVRLNPRAAGAIGLALAVIAVLAFVYFKGRSDAEKRERARDAIAAAEAIKSDTRANDKAARTVAVDALNRAHAEKELTDAVADLPDSLPDPVAVQLGCQRLRQAGISTADLPACGTARTGAQARPHP